MSLLNHNVNVVVYGGLCTFEFGVAVEIFGLPRPEMNHWYTFSLCAAEPGPLTAAAGYQMEVNKGLRSLSSAGTIVIPGWRDVDEHPPKSLLRSLRNAHARGSRLVSLCSGAFVLAAAGLLNHRSATTHWRYAAKLKTDYPQIDVNPDVLFVDDGSILTAAGSAAGIDLCLHIVRRDFGADAANSVARRLVVPPLRDGGQAQFIDRPVAKQADTDISKLLDRVRRQIEKPHSISSMARSLHMSERTLARRFRDQTGTTPMRWLTQERVGHAQQLLEKTNLDVEQVARACGFGTAQLLRFHFRRLTATSPSAYRKSFSTKSK